MLQVQERVSPDLGEYSFDDVARVASEVGSLFAHWQNDECQSTKNHLLEIEDGNSGRVRLVDFYNAALHKGIYQFTETINYLRQLGTLDESDELTPRVIIPNYVAGRSNCVARTSYYEVCCLDSCEGIFGKLEAQLSKSIVTAEEVGRIEGVLSGGLLRRRLDEIATHHGGDIPLHGRLFAQWMHLAHPRECPYPHLSGTVYYNSIENWETETGERSGLTMKEIEHWSTHLAELNQQRIQDNTEPQEDHVGGMWSMEEELVTISQKPPLGNVAKTMMRDGRSWLLESFSSVQWFLEWDNALLFSAGLAGSILYYFRARGASAGSKGRRPRPWNDRWSV
jgi:hypothetical protein